MLLLLRPEPQARAEAQLRLGGTERTNADLEAAAVLKAAREASGTL